MAWAVYPHHRLRFVADAGLDDQKLFAWAAAHGEFVIRASHLERHVAIYNPRRNRWEPEVLRDLVDTAAFGATWPPPAVQWRRKLGGKVEVAMDRNGPYRVLRGLAALWQTVATLTFLIVESFPRHVFAPRSRCV